MGFFDYLDNKKKEKEQNIAKWNRHIRECIKRNRIAQIRHLDDYLDFQSFSKNDTMVMARMCCHSERVGDEMRKYIRVFISDKNGDEPQMSFPVDEFEAFRVFFKIIPFFIVKRDDNSIKYWLQEVKWNYGSSYDCDDTYSGKTYWLADEQEDYDTNIKSENDIFIKKEEIRYLSDKALLYFYDIIQSWKNLNFSEQVGDYNLWKSKRSFIIGYEKNTCDEINKRGLNNDKNQTSKENFGAQGEENVEYALKWLPKTYKKVQKNSNGIVLKNLDVSDEHQEIDHIVIAPNGVFIIETKYLKGNIKIDSYGNWSREIEGELEGLKNPIQQVDRHHQVVSSILEGLVDEKDIHDVICLAYDTCTVTGIENSPVMVVKVDNLGRKITEIKGAKEYNSTDIKEMLDRIEKYRI